MLCSHYVIIVLSCPPFIYHAITIIVYCHFVVIPRTLHQQYQLGSYISYKTIAIEVVCLYCESGVATL